MRRRTWILVGLGIAGAVTVVGLIWLAFELDDRGQAQDVLRDLDTTDPVLNSPPPDGAIEIQRFGFDDCWNVDSGAQEPLVYRVYEFDGDPAEFRAHYESLLREHGWVDGSSPTSEELLIYSKVFDERTAEFRLVEEDGTYRLGATVDYEFCDDER